MQADPIHLIDTEAGLLDVAQSLASQEWVAVDTEFLREETYFAKLCLLQLAWPTRVVCIDPLALPRLEPLWEALARPTLLKVLHACRQDLEIFAQKSGSAMTPVFDTQVAAPLLGLPEQMSYAALVERRLGINLDKAHTRADWSKRPLPAAWLDYAADDVRHLAALYPGLRADLEARGRLEWLAAEFIELAASAARITAPEEAWQRLRGTERLNPRQRGALVQLAAWRERTARDLDRPRGWMLKDESLVDIARALPKDAEALRGIRGLNDKVLGRHGSAILAAVAAGSATPVNAEAGPRRGSPFEDDALVDAVMAVVRILANEAEVNPSLLANRKALEAWLMGEAPADWLSGWRGNILAQGLNDFRAGRLGLQVGPRGLELVPRSEPQMRAHGSP